MDRYHGSEERELHHQNSSNNSLPPSSSSPAAAADAGEEREYMFEKVVTPSDVGKLNRLVIPKQYAERYFPLDRASTEEAGRVLSFEEDPAGRTWRFRYSYWNSSQSYVMTKGWSRFVKDKRLSAGDTVTFSRCAASTGRRLFIDWCYRPPPPDPPHLLRSSVPWGWGGRLFVPPPPPPPSSAAASASTNSASAMYYRSVGRPVPPLLRMGGRISDSVPLRVAEPKRVRLFGVNLDCSEQKHDDHRQQRERESTNHLPPPSPLQWRLSPTPAPSSRGELLQLPAMDQEGARR